MGSSGGDKWKLADHPKLPKGKTIALVVLDGWGEANADQYNCIHVAETPTMDSLKQVLYVFLRFFDSQVELDPKPALTFDLYMMMFHNFLNQYCSLEIVIETLYSYISCLRN